MMMLKIAQGKEFDPLEPSHFQKRIRSSHKLFSFLTEDGYQTILNYGQ